MPRPSARLPVLALGVGAGAAHVWLNGVLVWPYLGRTGGDFQHQYEAAARLLAGGSPFGSAWYDYPPLPALLLLPLAGMSFEAARLAWFLIGHLCLLGAALLLVRPLGGDRAAVLAVGGAWLLGGTVQENLVLGQWNPVLLLLLALALWFDARRPAGAAGLLGLAAAIKIWPGLLLAADLLRRRRRALATGLAVAAGGVILPGLAIAALAPPPHLPTHGAFWMGSPAPLNLSLPAAALRATYRGADRPGAAMPLDWEVGNNPAVLQLSPERRMLSLAVSLALLLAGLLLLAYRTGRRNFSLSGPPLLAALVALALVAAPIAWYHYQLLQLPGIAWLAAGRLRGLAAVDPQKKAPGREGVRGVLPLLGLVALLIGLTRAHLWYPVARWLGAGEGQAVQVAGWAVPALGIVLFLLLVRELGGAPEGSR